ncbi:MAG: hypothetical protein PHX77_03170, partial [Candidatus Bipolaricaulis sp.]|nr:hypothetical protein [Candidatus Bipolaricaulis sp.]
QPFRLLEKVIWNGHRRLHTLSITIMWRGAKPASRAQALEPQRRRRLLCTRSDLHHNPLESTMAADPRARPAAEPVK